MLKLEFKLKVIENENKKKNTIRHPFKGQSNMSWTRFFFDLAQNRNTWL
jgi:hypothetical protein